jgi:hypothetical protein
MSVLAFLQNAYTRDEETARKLEVLFGDPSITGRTQYLRKQGLFEGRNYTGLTIQRVFGAKVCDAIWWENASPRWGWLSKHKFPADMAHIRRLCEEHRPSIVLTFGKVASDALADLKHQFDSPLQIATIISGPHPAARDPKKYEMLRAMNAQLNEIAAWVECQHCAMLTTGGSHCEHCYKCLDWGPDDNDRMYHSRSSEVPA